MSKLNLGDSLILDTDYSTSEVKTGATWIDGKPIYRKTFTGTSPASAYTYTSVITIPNGAYIIYFFGEVGGLPINAIRPVTDSTINSVYTTWVTRNGNTGLDMVCGTNCTNKGYTITVFYTKTTD